MTLDTDTSKWTAGAPIVDKFFTNKNGTFKFFSILEIGMQLVSPQSDEVDFFRGLNASSAVCSGSTGRASEKVLVQITDVDKLG